MCELGADIAKANNGAQGSARQFKEEYIMVVQHNLTAMNSNRMLGLTTASQAKSTEKLSSGYKINRAADDAAGLSISEKMRKQIRGLTQASLNAQDGISAVQTAEGALTEVHDMLQRMNELAVKSANGTNSEDDRGYIQDEIDQLVKEIDRVSETTKFNETYLLKGTKTDEDVTSLDSVTIKAGKEFKESFTLKNGSTFWAVDAAGQKTALTEATKATDLAKYIDAEGNAKDGYKIYKVDAADKEWGTQVSGQVADAATIKAQLDVSTTGLMDKNGKEIKATDLKNYFDQNGVYQGGLYSRLSADGKDPAGTGTKGQLVEIGADKLTDFVDVKTKTDKKIDALNLSLHVGADGEASNKIDLSIKSMSAQGIGVSDLKVNTADSATAAIETLKNAIQTVSTQRSALGAVQNRLEHTINNLDNVVENTTSAESQIRDTDMATEMVKYSNNNILAQAGQAMLAQSNQANQGYSKLKLRAGCFQRGTNHICKSYVRIKGQSMMGCPFPFQRHTRITPYQ